jgi:hypothetical protein
MKEAILNYTSSPEKKRKEKEKGVKSFLDCRLNL